MQFVHGFLALFLVDIVRSYIIVIMLTCVFLRSMASAENVREQLGKLMTRLELRLVSTEFTDRNYYTNIKKALTAGMFMQVGFSFFFSFWTCNDNGLFLTGSGLTQLVHCSVSPPGWLCGIGERLFGSGHQVVCHPVFLPRGQVSRLKIVV